MEESAPFLAQGAVAETDGGMRATASARHSRGNNYSMPMKRPSSACLQPEKYHGRRREGLVISYLSMALCAVALLMTGAFVERTLLAGGGKDMTAECDGSSASPAAARPGPPTGDSVAETSTRAETSRSPLSFAPSALNWTSAATGGGDPDSPALFLFVMGTEGTGHHLFGNLYRLSPSFRRLSSWGFVFDGTYKRLLASLYNRHSMSEGLWSAPCAQMMKGKAGTGNGAADGPARLEETVAAMKELERGIRLNHDKKKHGNKPTVVAIGGVKLGKGRKRGEGRKNGGQDGAEGGSGQEGNLVEDIVKEEGADDSENEDDAKRRLLVGSSDLDAVVSGDDVGKNTIADDNSEKEDEAVPTIDINARYANSKFNFAGMLSYPNFQGPCRPLQYPDLSLLYDACSMAGVNCLHVFVHRDPHSTIHSIARRGFGDFGAAYQMKLEGTMLDVARAQLQDHPDKLAACWDYDVGTDDVVEASRGGGIQALGEMLGWNKGEFWDVYREIYKPSEPLSEEERNVLTDAGRVEPYMRGVVRSMERAVETCRAIYEAMHNVK